MPTTARPDLREVVTAARSDHRHWSTPDARALFEVAVEKLAPVARRFGADPADALSHALEVWIFAPESVLADETCDLWAYTAQAVRHAFEAEAVANAKGTSAAAARRAHASSIRGLSSLDDIEVAYTPFDTDPDEQDPAVAATHAKALAVLDSVLVMVGFTLDQRAFFVDVLADIVAGSPSQRATLSRAQAVRDVVRPEMTPGQWKALTEIVFGTPTGKPGIIALAAAGHVAPAVEPHIASRIADALQVTA